MSPPAVVKQQHEGVSVTEKQLLHIGIAGHVGTTKRVDIILSSASASPVFPREGWLGKIGSVDAIMNRHNKQPHRDWLAKYHAGVHYIFAGCDPTDYLLEYHRPIL